ncbi:hypothetical protein JB92DRAFT_1357620 [Gautieria morchelliformis]|nr:hypothetical protein JB92DRAFT_1357620 [Gautieria morchelliformis]
MDGNKCRSLFFMVWVRDTDKARSMCVELLYCALCFLVFCTSITADGEPFVPLLTVLPVFSRYAIFTVIFIRAYSIKPRPDDLSCKGMALTWAGSFLSLSQVCQVNICLLDGRRDPTRGAPGVRSLLNWVG